MKLVVHLTVECGTYPTSGSNSVRPHAVTGAGSNTYVYDANGNMTSGAGRTIAYDHENRPTSITKNGTTTNFLYDGDGGRAKKTVDDGRLTVETIYISELYVCTVTVSPSCAKMIFSGSQRIAMVQINDGSTSYFHPDHLGSTSVLTDSHGVSEQDVAYYPYGETRTDTSTTTPVLDIAYKYTGKEQDDSTGLYFYEARYYDPVLGRFISADTIVPDPLDPQTLNRFSYVLNNPLKLIDPSGNISIGFGGGGFGGGYGGSSLGGYGGGYEGYSGSSSGSFSDFSSGSFSSSSSYSSPSYSSLNTFTPSSFSNSYNSYSNVYTTSTPSEYTGSSGPNFSSLANSSGSNVPFVSTGSTRNSSNPSLATFARLSEGVYNQDFSGADGFQRTNSYDRPDIGFQAALFERGNQRILAFAGTNPGSLANWIANFKQAFGFESAQYTYGLSIARELSQAGGNLYFTGHSLGGGIAAASAIFTKGRAITFNPAAIHSNTVDNLSMSRGSIINYQSTFDVLQIGNALTPASVPGRSISLGAAGFHGMSGICRAVGC